MTHSEDRPAFWLAIVVATVLAIAGLKWLLRERSAPPPHTWVALETRWAEPDVRLLGIAFPGAYRSRSACQARLPVSDIVTLGHHTFARHYECVRVGPREGMR